ncbi:MAG: putative zinc-binding metallopeptidase [Rubrivivax sp.]|nr:putative zinc-binding metallopeptidase [Rubrivivax sp.]
MGWLDTLFERLQVALARPQAARSWRCRCGAQVFFGNSQCLACGTPLGFDPASLALRPLPLPGPDGAPQQRCVNFTAVGCNWLLPAREAARQGGLCRACRLNRTLPDLAQDDNREAWRAIETAKRRLVSQLLALGLPVHSRLTEDPARGLMFDFLRPLPGAAVLTGHAGGLITLNVEEADDARREQIRRALREPYRTLLGHLRHEIGHYYWDRLVAGSGWLPLFRQRFGDERESYAAALQRHYQHGPRADWSQSFISAYASTHPWEDWAESFAHYLHLIDTVDTALSYGLSADDVDMAIQPFGRDALDNEADAPRFLRLLNGWLELTAVLNELSRSMGQPDFYPFVLSRAAVAKLHLVHRVVVGV